MDDLHQISAVGEAPGRKLLFDVRVHVVVAGSPAELLLVIMIEKVNAVRLPPLSGVGDRGADY